jgi:hypothetical protein
MNKKAPLNPTWLKARMLAEKIIAFSAYENQTQSIFEIMKVNIKQDIVEITVPQDILDGINNKKDKLEALEKDIKMKIIINIK